MSVDLRTRSDADVPGVDPSTFLSVDLPARAERRADLLEVAERVRPEPLALEVEGRSWRLVRTDRGIEVTEGGVADATLALTAERLADLVNDQITPVGLMTAGEFTLDQHLRTVMDWWLLLRSLVDERPVHRPGDVVLPDDVGRSFTLDDDPATLRSYLESCGYLHLQGVFTETQMAAVSDEMDAAADHYREGDGESWWAGTPEGRRLVRMQNFAEHSPTAVALLDDPRFLSIAEIPALGHAREAGRRNWLEGLFKPIGVQEGISDVPWHKDCSLGRHSYECCSLTVGISVTGAGPTSGQLRVIAGSHRALVWPSLYDAARVLDLPDIALPTGTGDVTVHLSCTLHMAQPPTERERRVLYTGFALPALDPEATAAGRRKLGRARETAPANASQPPAA